MPGIWIQRSDFTSDELPEVTPDEAMNIMEMTDWAAILKQKEERIKNGEDYCDPGFGIVFDDGEIIHLIEPANEPYRGFYHYRTQRRRFGIFLTTQDHTGTFEGLGNDDLYRAVREWSPVDPETTIFMLKAKVTA